MKFQDHLILLVAIIAEVIATTALARSDGFSRLWPSLIAIGGYGAAFWLLSFPLRTMPTGIVYAIWSWPQFLWIGYATGYAETDRFR